MRRHLDINLGSSHDLRMRTTINLDPDVYRAAVSLAAERKSSIGKVLSDLARRGLAPSVRMKEGSGFPVFDVPDDAPPITLEMVREAGEDT